MTTKLRPIVKRVTIGHGVKYCPKLREAIYGRSLMTHLFKKASKAQIIMTRFLNCLDNIFCLPIVITDDDLQIRYGV